MSKDGDCYTVAVRYAAHLDLRECGPSFGDDKDWQISIKSGTTVFTRRCCSLLEAIRNAKERFAEMGPNPIASIAIVFGAREQLAAALANAGHPGQLLVCGESADHISQCTGLERPFSLGIHVLDEDLPALEVFQWEISRLRTSFPRLNCLFQVRHNLAERSTPFFGRVHELDVLRDRLRISKIITLIGPEGIGKSSLAWRFGFEYAEEFPGGVWRIEVESYDTYQTLLSKLNEHVRARSTFEDIEKGCLIILDHCDVSLAACQLAFERLPGDVSNCRILATARQPLEVSGEISVPVLGLSFPCKDVNRIDELMEFDAVRMFWDRILMIDQGAELSRPAQEEITEICRRVSGSPMAISTLATLYAKSGIEAIRSNWKRYAPDNSDLSKVAAIESAFDGLTKWSQRALACFAVFAADWPAMAAQAIASLDSGKLNQSLRELSGAGLIELSISNEGKIRYRVASTAAAYVASLPSLNCFQLEASKRHFEYFALLSEDDASQIEREMPNLRLALSRAFHHKDPTYCIRLILALGPIWHRKGPHREAAELCEKACCRARESKSPELARLLNLSGTFRTFTGDLDVAELSHGEALTLSNRAGDGLTAAMALANLATIRKKTKDFTAAKSMLEQAILRLRALDDSKRLATCLTNYGAILDDLGDSKGAASALQESIQLFEGLGDEGQALTAKVDLAEIASNAGRIEEARVLYLDSLSQAVAAENPNVCALALEGLCLTLQQSGAGEVVALSLGVAIGIRAKHGMAPSSSQASRIQSAIARLESSVGKNHLHTQIESAKALKPREALEIIKESMNDS